MSKKNGSRKIGNNKASASNVSYKMQDRRSKNAKRKALAESKREARDATLRFDRALLRAKGALRRLKLRPNVSPALLAKVTESVRRASY